MRRILARGVAVSLRTSTGRPGDGYVQEGCLSLAWCSQYLSLPSPAGSTRSESVDRKDDRSANDSDAAVREDQAGACLTSFALPQNQSASGPYCDSFWMSLSIASNSVSVSEMMFFRGKAPLNLRIPRLFRTTLGGIGRFVGPISPRIATRNGYDDVYQTVS